MPLMKLSGGSTSSTTSSSAPQSGYHNTPAYGTPTYALPSNTRPSYAPNFLPVVGRISQAYGVRNSRYSAGYHTGLDIAANYGAPIRSAGRGTVIFAGYYGSYGYTVKVRHTDGSVGLYAHMSRIGVKVGQRIDFGMYLGAVGNSGNSTGAHLHWEIRKPGDRYGQQFDPRQWVSQQSKGGTNSYTGYSGGPLSLAQLKWVAMQAGFSSGAASVMAAIAMAESSGRPTAHNPNASTGDNSYGLWQINMIGNMGPERRRLFGIPSNEALFDPLTNAKAAFRIYQSQGLRAWSVYSSGRYRQYLSAAMSAKPQKITTSGGTTSSVTAGVAGGTTGMEYLAGLAAKATPEQLAAGAGFSVAFFRSDPELWGLLQQAIQRGDTDAGNLEAAIKQSNWWKRHSDAERRAIALQHSDPAQYKRLMDEQRLQIQNIAGNLGGTLSAADLAKLTKLAFHGGWSEGKITSFVVDMTNIEQLLSSGAEIGGRAGELQDAFGQWAGQFGIKVSDRTLASYAAKVLKGQATPQDFLSFVQKQAKALYPHLSDDIDRGMTLADMAQPFVQTAAVMLEESPDSIQLDSPHVRWALKGDGKTMVSMQDFEERIRRSKEWQTTDNARAAYDSFGRQILQDFGFAW